VRHRPSWVGLIGKDDKRYNAGEPGVGVLGAPKITGAVQSIVNPIAIR
jgi:hypothetical protein